MVLLLRRHVGLGSTIGELHTLVATGHIGLVRVIVHIIGLVGGVGVDVVRHGADLPLLHVGQCNLRSELHKTLPTGRGPRKKKLPGQVTHARAVDARDKTDTRAWSGGASVCLGI